MKIKITILSVLAAIVVSGCSDADVASYNLSKSADSFEVERRIVFFNGITDTYLLEIQGKCSLGNNDSPKRLSVTCKTGHNRYKKHFLGLSDNVSYLVEQTSSKNVSAYHYRVTFKPETIVPDIDYRKEDESQKVDN